MSGGVLDPPGDASRCENDELFDQLRERETLRNQLAAADHATINEIARRGLAHEHGYRDTAALLGDLLRISDGKARVKAAEDAGPRIGLTGEPLEPVFPHVAAAQREGVISPAHARVIVDCVERLPGAVAAECGEQVEESLVRFARELDPARLATAVQRVKAHLDPDGLLSGVGDRHRRRGFTIRQRSDGSSSVTGELTAACTENLLTVMDTLARPHPAAEGERDPRTAEQRRHDALQDACTRLIASKTLPDVGGVTATVVITMSDEAWQAGRGTATTGHGAIVPASYAINELAGGDCRLLAVAINSLGAITGHGRTHRLFTETQRLAMTARDGGCSFPGCTIPAAWTQAHHVRAWIHDGMTTVTNGTLLCGHHHRTFEKSGWSCEIRDGHPVWIPPPHVDPDQRPLTNAAQHLEIAFDPSG